MLLDISPLRRHRDFRLVFIGQLVSSLGGFITYVALPVQVYALTQSSAVVGLIGAAQLVPLAMAALWGGAVADALDRRTLLLRCEALMACGSLALVVNSLLPNPSVTALFVIAAFLSAVNGFHRPALEAITQKLVARDELAAVSALASLRGTVAAIAGPSLAGLSIAAFGLPVTYSIEVATFAVSVAALAAIRAMPPADTARPAGIATILTRGWIDPANRNNDRADVTTQPGRFYDVDFDMQPRDSIVPAGNRLALMVLSSDRDFTIRPAPGTRVTLDVGRSSLSLPVVGGAAAFG